MTQRHRKLFSAGERLGAKLFADWYRFGNGKRPAGIVHYVGGAITEDKYRRRRGTRPDAIATHFRAALARTRLRCVDLLVSSAPPYPPGPREDILRDFRDHVVVDLLQQVPAPRPHPVAFVGNSTGAFLATYLAFSVPGSRSLATPLYTEADAQRAADLFRGVDYSQAFEPVPGVRVKFIEAGHILGSAAISLEIQEKGKTIRFWFSGDIGRFDLPLLRDPVMPDPVDYLLIGVDVWG